MTARLRVDARGAVQGVGFRPFVHGLAAELGLAGWVRNTPAGVQIEVEGARPRLDDFLARLRTRKPPRAAYHLFEYAFLEPTGLGAFEIRESDRSGPPTGAVLPDLVTCADCLREVLDPRDRRFRYPFTNCTHCGPRFSIQLAVPWDRPNTTMRAFSMCTDCRCEYDDPRDRRFHAQPIACPACGPAPAFGEARGDEALRAAAEAIRAGRIVALKGLGGYQLVCDARDGAAVRRLRDRKRREEKPFAVMTLRPEALAELSPEEDALLRSPEGPIVLARRRAGGVCHEVAPGNPLIGLMLPTTPLHHLLLRDLGFPVVATSANLSDEPIAFDNQDAHARLGHIADAFLDHDRPIARPLDDSVVRVIAGRPTVLRRSRGYAPLPVAAARGHALATGGHQKAAVALATPGGAVLGPHVGDLDTAAARAAFERSAADLRAFFDSRPGAVACDVHPDYASTAFARTLGLPVTPVQHHAAHVFSCLAEHAARGPALGVAWDGTGLGPDGTVWGGEFLVVDGASWKRFAHLRTFPLPGGDAAARDARRAALGLVWEARGTAAPEVAALFRAPELVTLVGALRAGVNCPRASSAGRLFDGVSALLGLVTRSAFEGQAATAVEFAADPRCRDAYSLPFELPVLDWTPLLEALLADLRCGEPTARIAARFHNALAAGIVAVARAAAIPCVALSGGCFQNGLLVERVVEGLESEGFEVLRHERVPPNDGGLALGQLMAAEDRA
jgi:hydrogenase maturation protein HypF